jgi:hypothetical protein
MNSHNHNNIIIIMNLRHLVIAILLACTASQKIHAQVLSDDFNDITIDSALWQVRQPFLDSSVSEGGGAVSLLNRGTIISQSGLPTVFDLTSSFTFAGSEWDRFEMRFRADDSTQDPTGSPHEAIQLSFRFRPNDDETPGPRVFLHNFSNNVGTLIASADYNFTIGAFTPFRLIDDGANIAVYVGDLTTPLFIGTDSAVYGNLLSFASRDGAGGGSAISDGSLTKVDYVQVVPEPSSAILAVLGVFGLIFWRQAIWKVQGTGSITVSGETNFFRFP